MMIANLERLFQAVPKGLALVFFVVGGLFFLFTVGRIWDRFLYEESGEIWKREVFRGFFFFGIVLLVGWLVPSEPARTMTESLVLVLFGLAGRIILRAFPNPKENS